MTLSEAVNAAIYLYGMDRSAFEDGSCAVVRLRQGSSGVFPEYGVDGSIRDSASWAMVNANEKIDTGIYGAVYFF